MLNELSVLRPRFHGLIRRDGVVCLYDQESLNLSPLIFHGEEIGQKETSMGLGSSRGASYTFGSIPSLVIVSPFSMP